MSKKSGKRGQRCDSAVREARVACGLMVSLGKFAVYAPTLWIIDGDKYHMELRGSPLECARLQAQRNVSLQMLTAGTSALCLSLFIRPHQSISLLYTVLEVFCYV